MSGDLMWKKIPIGVVLVLSLLELAQGCGRVQDVGTANPTATASPVSVVPGIPDSVFQRYGIHVSAAQTSSLPPVSHDQAIAIVTGGASSVRTVQSATLVQVTATSSITPAGMFWIVVFKPGYEMSLSGGGPPASPGGASPPPEVAKYSFVLVDANTGQIGLALETNG